MTESRGRFRVVDALILVVVGGALLAAAWYSKTMMMTGSNAEVAEIVPPTIEWRDLFYGAASPTPETVWIAGSNGKVVRSDDGGSSFEVQTTPVETNLQDIDSWSRERAVAVGNDGVVIVTSDGGSHWTAVEAPRSEIANKLIRVRCTDEGRAWTVGVMGMIASTEDWGASWRRRAQEIDLAWNDIAFADASNGWVVGEFGSMMRTTDAGETWTEAEPQSERSLMAIAFRDPSHAVAVGLDGLILVTEDGGTTWERADAGTSIHLFDVIWDGSRWVAVGDMGSVITGSVDARAWTVDKLSPDDLAWHTALTRVGERLLVVGGSLGFWNHGRWTPVGSG
jgi:photosystem II stability/assembly factor-like uncharacterized protein